MQKIKGLSFLLVCTLSLLGLSFLTPLPWIENSAEKPILKENYQLKTAPLSFDAKLEKPTDSLKFKKIDSILNKAFMYGQCNGQFLYAENGEIIYNKAFGYKRLDGKNKTSLNNDYRFQLASTSKPFTAIGIMLLHQAGKIHIDSLVQTYLPDFPFKNITVRLLLQHRSGIPNYIYIADAYWDRSKPLTNADLSPLLKKYAKGVDFLPNRRFKYCNTNYAYLASIIESVSGMKYADYLQKYVFDPLHMNHTFIYTPGKSLDRDSVVIGFSKRKGRFLERRPDYLDGVVGDKGIFSTVEDLFLFDLALYDTNFISSEMAKMIFTPAQPLDEKHDNDYGLGFRIKKHEDGSTVSFHHGWWKGFRNYYIHDYENQRTLIWLNNRSDITVSSYIDAIMNQTKSCSDSEQEFNASENYGSK